MTDPKPCPVCGHQPRRDALGRLHCRRLSCEFSWVHISNELWNRLVALQNDEVVVPEISHQAQRDAMGNVLYNLSVDRIFADYELDDMYSAAVEARPRKEET